LNITVLFLNLTHLQTEQADKIVYTTGCIPTMVKWIHDHIFALACIAVGLAIPQIIGVCLSRILLLQIKDQNEYFYEKVQEATPVREVDENAEESNV